MSMVLEVEGEASSYGRDVISNILSRSTRSQYLRCKSNQTTDETANSIHPCPIS